MSTLTATQLQQQYIAYFGRPGDPAGITYWLSSNSGISSAREFADKIYAQDEYKKSTVGSKSTEAQVNSLYQNLFGRDADAAGLLYWTGQIEAGTLSLSNIAFDLIAAASNPVAGNETQGSADALALSNKVAAAEAFTADVEASTSAILAYQPESTSPWTTGAAFESGKSYLTGITTTAHTASGIDAAVSSMITANTSAGSTVAGTTDKFTTGTDSLVGGAGDDTYNAVLQGAGATGTTIAPGDNVDGKAGTDTIAVAVAGTLGADYTLSAITTSNVETVTLSNFQTHNSYDVIVDAALMDSALTTVGNSSSGASGDTQFTGLKEIVDAVNTNGAGDLKLIYNSSVVTGTSDVQNVSLSNLTGGTFTADGIETIAVTSSTAKSTGVVLVSSALKKVTVAGDKDLTISTALDFASNGTKTAPGAVVDASTFTGGLTLTTTASEFLDIKGGSGADKFTLASLTLDDSVDGGAGSDEVVVDAAAFTTEFTKVSNVEKVTLNDLGTALSLDASKLSAGVTQITVTLKDDGTGANALESTISNLTGESVVITRADEDADVDGQLDVTLTPKTDTESDSISTTLFAVGVNGDEVDDTDGDEYGVGNLDVANYETVNLTSSPSTDGTTIVKNELDTLTATKATTVNVSGTAELQLDAVSGGALTKFDASDLAAKLAVTFSADKVAVTGAQKDSTIAFGTSLDNNDSVTGGAGTDTVTASFTDVGETAGTLNISGVETITLTNSGTNTFNFASVSGATTISSDAGTNTIKGFDLATTLEARADQTFKVTGADVSGSSDVLKVSSVASNASDDITIEAAGIETLDITVKDTHASDNTTDTRGFDLDKFEGTTVKFTQHADSNSAVALTIDLAATTLHKNVTTVDTTGTKGPNTITAANATNAVTFDLAGGAIQSMTGGAKADTFNIAETGAIAHVITGGAGTDTTNINIKNGFVDPSTIATENVNFTVTAGDDVTLTAVNSTTTTALVVKGGNSISTFTTAANGVVNELKTFNSSDFLGNVVLKVTKNIIDDTIVFTGGSHAKDEIEYEIDAAGTDKLYSSGVEILDLLISEDSTLDLSNATGVKTIDVNVIAAKTATITELTGSELILITDGSADSDVSPALADATGSADSLTFEVKDGGSDIVADLDLNTSDIETVTIKASSAEQLDLSGLAMTTAGEVMTLKVTGDKALTVSALNADVTTIDASGMTEGGSIIQTGRSATAVAAYTGSVGNDTFIMTKTGDVIAAGGEAATGGDTLDLNYVSVIGGANIDLSSTTDQVTSLDGTANAAVQSGFENVELTGHSAHGAVVTGSDAANRIAGTPNADNISAGKGNDEIVVIGTTANSDVIDGGAGTGDELELAASASYTQATDATLQNVENIEFVGAGTVVLTGQTEAFTYTSGDGVQTITSGSGDDTISVGLATDGDIDTVHFASTAALNGVDTVTGLQDGEDGDNADVLDFSDFLGATAKGEIVGSGAELTVEASEGSVFTSVTGGSEEGGTDLAGMVFFAHITTASLAQMKTNIVTATANDALYLASGAKAVMLHGEVTESISEAFDVYYITGGGGDAETVTKVGSVTFADNADVTFDSFH
jgi:hypothetical protein